jgi:hypothetical protein
VPSPKSGVDPLEILLECTPEIGKGGLLVAAASTAAVPLAVAGAAIAGIDIAQCLVEGTNEALKAEAIRLAIADCAAQGKIPAMTPDGTSCTAVRIEP